MNYRQFGRTDMHVSEIGFGAWAIGGSSYGPVASDQALQALHAAEALGCNFVDTAAIYGNSEQVLGEFLASRRNKWLLASKYSGQAEGMTAFIEKQLKALQTDYIDFYQLHWAPGKDGHHLYTELEQLKQSGKIRYAGVSLYNAANIDYVIANTNIDGFQIKFGLLDPLPLLNQLNVIRHSGLGVIVRSCLKEGFLSGKYNRQSAFSGTDDQRSKWSAAQLSKTLKQVEAMRFLETEQRSLLDAAIAYPLGFDVVSTVIVGTKSSQQAAVNFADRQGTKLSRQEILEVEKRQRRMGLLFTDTGPWRKFSRVYAAIKSLRYT